MGAGLTINKGNAMKTLNLDSLAKTERTLTLGGETYPVIEMTVENFIQTTRQAQKLEEEGKTTFADQIEATVEMISRSVPKCPVEKLRALSIDQLITVSKFLRGEFDGETVAGQKDGEEAKN